ncbi:MAG: GAF domain-containing protein, partial [candidate division Zixibacteria bacterium]|nr:GAF domain-containing protein [candidate division Zixibacteria bacterium]
MAGTQTEFWDKLKSALEVKINRQVQSSRALRRRLFDLHTIFEISKQLNSLLDLEQLLDAIVSTAAGQTGAVSAAILMQASHQNDRLGLLRVQGLAPPEKIEGVPVSGNLVQVLLNKNKPLFFSELERVLASGSDEIRLLQILGCELCLPVISKNKILGILCLGSKNANLEYHQSDLEFLSALVNNLAVTLENARLYESIKSANQEVQKTQTQLAEKEKLAALGELAASLAHEIN